MPLAFTFRCTDGFRRRSLDGTVPTESATPLWRGLLTGNSVTPVVTQVDEDGAVSDIRPTTYGPSTVFDQQKPFHRRGAD